MTTNPTIIKFENNTVKILQDGLLKDFIDKNKNIYNEIMNIHINFFSISKNKNEKIKQIIEDNYNILKNNQDFLFFYYWITNGNVMNLQKIFQFNKVEEFTSKYSIDGIRRTDINEKIYIQFKCRYCKKDKIAYPLTRSHRNEILKYIKSGSYECDECYNNFWNEVKISDELYEKEQRILKKLDTKDINILKSMDYNDYLLTDHWKNKREEAFKYYGNKCQLCNSTYRLQVHHNTYQNKGNEKLSDLAILCKNCHNIFHSIIKIK